MIRHNVMIRSRLREHGVLSVFTTSKINILGFVKYDQEIRSFLKHLEIKTKLNAQKRHRVHTALRYNLLYFALLNFICPSNDCKHTDVPRKTCITNTQLAFTSMFLFQCFAVVLLENFGGTATIDLQRIARSNHEFKS